MSLSLNFISDTSHLQRLQLPTRYYYYNDTENYVKLLSIGEGIFPKDKINYKFSLQNSHCVISTESATKVYPSADAYGIGRYDFTLTDKSNLEYINDELILFKDSKYLQLFTLRADKSSSFFYTDIISNGRSFEHFDFDLMRVRNRFIIDGKLEYFENFTVSGSFLETYFQRHNATSYLLAKVYIKIEHNDALEEKLRKMDFVSFTFSHSKKMLIGLLSSENMGKMKKEIATIWNTYREHKGLKPFHLGKQ